MASAASINQAIGAKVLATGNFKYPEGTTWQQVVGTKILKQIEACPEGGTWVDTYNKWQNGIDLTRSATKPYIKCSIDNHNAK